MNVASFIARRLVFQKNQSFSRFIIRLSAAATAISVAVMILAFAFVEGFQFTVSSKVFSFWGHLRVQQQQSSTSGLAEELPVEKNDSVYNILRNHKQVKYADAFATKSAMLKTKETIEGVLLKGVEKNFSKERLLPFLVEGKWIQFDDSTKNNQVLISQYTSRQTNAKVGDKILIYFIDNNSTAPRVRPVTVCGIYKTGIEEYDKTFAIVDINLIRKLNAWTPTQIGGYELTLHDYRTDYQTNNELLDQIPFEWFSTPLREIYPNIFDWLELQNINKKVILIVMCIVAIINLISCLIILVLERSKMIGLLKATGATNQQVQTIFWNQALIIAVTGIIAGTLLGLGICWLQQATGFIKLDEAAYYVAEAPIRIIWWQVVLINVITFMISFLILLIPSLLVRKISPVKALRFE
ncbi:MAG: ABC transporter permease [Chitinophagaceae bacterium]|nr:ABC transporter permease [Chitinophagaceae bacterium]